MAQQTAVEWLVNELLFIQNLKEGEITESNKGILTTSTIEQAKQMEKEQMGYSKEDVLKAGEIGEINHHDYKHIVKLLDEAREINRKNK